MADETKIYVFADWIGLPKPTLMGELYSFQTRGNAAYSFSYDADWLKSDAQQVIDPNIQFYSGQQFSPDNQNFGIFLDSMPDTWGRTLMKRRAATTAREKKAPIRRLREIDYLLGVYDETRMGGLRFKTKLDGLFLDNNPDKPTPPWSDIRTLQAAAKNIEEGNEKNLDEWLSILMAPGSSLGGARPKANIVDTNKELWIAKFPSKNDTTDKGAWEYLAYLLAVKAGIKMTSCKMERVAGRQHTFFTKRFDRNGTQRIHFSSAMTMTGLNEEFLRTRSASYLDIAEVIMVHGAAVKEDLTQLWRRIVFNIMISNTDDHLRNHGFILTKSGWRLSPAYDINPSTDKNGLALNINEDENLLDIELAKSVGEYFRLSPEEMNQILDGVTTSVKTWEGTATQIGISRGEQELMKSAFHK